MKKINIAELLKDCPHGMELDCALCEDVTLIHVLDGIAYPVKIDTPVGIMSLNKYGCCSNDKHSKCIIFPKGKTTWEGFAPPIEVKDGDIITCTNVNCSFVSIFKEMTTSETFTRYVSLTLGDEPQFLTKGYADFDKPRFATEEEKQKLFQAMKDNGYKWNADTKTLEKLIEPKFKVGDNIRIKGTLAIYVVTEIREDRYMLDDKDVYLLFKNQDQWKLAPSKFDITTLVPFESRVLIRDNGYSLWQPGLWGLYDKEHRFPYVTIGCRYKQCIPYEGNEHLLGTTNDCDEYYKTWEKKA